MLLKEVIPKVEDERLVKAATLLLSCGQTRAAVLYLACRAIVQEALELFSETKSNMNWTKKKLHERIEVIQKWGKLLDVFLQLIKFNITLMLPKPFMVHCMDVHMMWEHLIQNLSGPKKRS